ncbi:MAG: hypothetical protein IKD77_05770 [Bacilli bacterium]|nr:hypothetical protein [Bacilli bacterium]
MEEYIVIGYSIQELDEIIKSKFRNSKELKESIKENIKTIAKNIKICDEYLSINLYLSSIKLLQLKKISSELKLDRSENEKLLIRKFENIRDESIEKLENLVNLIVTSTYLRELFELNECLNGEEMQRLTDDILQYMTVLNYCDDDQITNSILKYMKKFCE